MGYFGDESEDDAGVDEASDSGGGAEPVESEDPVQEAEPEADASSDDDDSDDQLGRCVVTRKDMEDNLEDQSDLDAGEALRLAREMSQRTSRMMLPHARRRQDPRAPLLRLRGEVRPQPRPGRVPRRLDRARLLGQDRRLREADSNRA